MNVIRCIDKASYSILFAFIYCWQIRSPSTGRAVQHLTPTWSYHKWPCQWKQNLPTFFPSKTIIFFKCMFGSAPTISHLQSRVATSLNGCNFFLVQLFLHHTVCNSWSQQCCSAYYVLYVNAPWNIKTTIGLKSQNHNPLIAFFISAAGRWHNISIFKQIAFVLTKLGLILIPLQLQDLFFCTMVLKLTVHRGGSCWELSTALTMLLNLDLCVCLQMGVQRFIYRDKTLLSSSSH